MATIVGIEVDGGAAIAGDRQLTQGGTVRSGSKQRVFDFGEVGAAAVGESGGIDEFQRRLEAEVRDYETKHGDPMEVTRLANVASDIAEDEGVEAIVTGRDDREVARIRGVSADGGVTTDAVIAKGSGAQFTLGVLEGTDRALSLDSAEDLLRDAIDTAADRDTETGEDVDTYSIDSDGGGRLRD